MKRCFKCGLEKPTDEFYRHPQMGDGHLGKCKECAKADVRENYLVRRDYYRDYYKARHQTAERREWCREQQRKHRAAHPDRARARQAVNNAVRDGRLIKLPCETCGDPKSQGHHEDYSKPLEVRWLCLQHHRAAEGRVARGRAA